MALHLLGIRHHGPGSARSVVAALEAAHPSILLVEAPADAGPALRWIAADSGLEPPVALIGYAQHDPRRAVVAPFARFSPEWQAVTWANDRGIAVEPIDLPLAITLAERDADPELALVASPAAIDPLAELAAAAGDSDPERWWEDVIEHRGDGAPAFEAVAEAIGAVRVGTLPSLAERRREAHMRRAIRAAIRAGHTSVAVVCGAWHVPALDLDAPDTPSVTTDTATLRGLRTTKVSISWVPWTHRRLAASTGYAAGVESPGWYDHVFRHPGPHGVSRFFVQAARLLRTHDLSASPDHLIGASRLADVLAAIRERPRPGLAEVLDAADAVLGGMPLIERSLVIGDAIGHVPDAAPQVPLARDLAQRQRACRLTPGAADRLVELDLRTPNGLRRSHLLHQLVAIGIGWGSLEQGRGSSGTFRETWRLSWRPELSLRVVEHAGTGTTVEAVAVAGLVERATTAGDLATIATALDHALLAGLPAAVTPIVVALSTRAASDPDVVHLMAALAPLAGAQRYGDVRDTDATALRDAFDGIVVRALAGVVPACHSLDAEAAAAFVEHLSAMQQALALVDHRSRRSAFPAVLAQLAEHAGHGLVQGRATRILHDAGGWSTSQVEARLSRALSGGTPPATGAAFVEGLLAGSGTLLLHDRELRQLVDRWLASLTPQAFDETVPLLRRTFGGFEPAERRQLGVLLSGGSRPSPSIVGDDLDAQRLAATVVTVRHLLGLAVDSVGVA